MNTIKVITFDLDNTLWDVENVMLKAEAHLRSWLTAEVPEVGEYYSADSLREVRSGVLKKTPALIHDLSNLRREVIYQTIRISGYADAEARKYAEAAFAEFYDARHRVEYFDGALDTLARLSENYRLGALTNGNADFRKLKLDKFFSFGVSSADVGVGKPAPDMFLHALAHTESQAAETIHVGDHLIDDIQGASEVGMHTIWVNAKNETAAGGTSTPTRAVGLISDVPTAVESIQQNL